MEPITLEGTTADQRRLAEALLAKGLLTHISEGYPEGYVEPPPMVVSGELVSEAILRDRP